MKKAEGCKTTAMFNSIQRPSITVNARKLSNCFRHPSSVNVITPTMQIPTKAVRHQNECQVNCSCKAGEFADLRWGKDGIEKGMGIKCMQT